MQTNGGADPGRWARVEDFRVMLEKEPSIDAVLCATPDHLHAYVSVLAMQAGKHTFCEKPLTHNVWEARRVAAVANETGLATQMGNIGGNSARTGRSQLGSVDRASRTVSLATALLHVPDRRP